MSYEAHSAQLSVATLERMRLWRTWLLAVTAIGQGAQWLAAPARALGTPAFGRVNPALGELGWRLVGVFLLLVAVLLVARRTRLAGHVLGAVVYLALTFACALAGYWPALTVLAAGLHYGEVWVAGRRRRRGVQS